MNYSINNDNKIEKDDIVSTLLNDDQYHIEFNGHLTNHAKHAVIALAGLGMEPERIKAFYENHADETTYGYGLEPRRSSKYAITEDNWKEYLGKRTSFSSYMSFFDAEADRLGIKGMVEAYLPTLVNGWVGAFTHATIHFGWALSVNNRYMIVEGIAYMAFSYVSCHPDRMASSTLSANAEERPVDSLISIAQNIDPKKKEFKQWVLEMIENEDAEQARLIHPELRRSGLQYRIARMLGEGHELIYQRPAWLDNTEPQELWSELNYMASILYLAKPGDFVWLHLITSLYAMEQIAVYLPEEAQKKVIQCYWIGLLCVVFSGGEFPKSTKLQALNARFKGLHDNADSKEMAMEWETMIARAYEEEEEHNPKLVFVLKRMWHINDGQSVFRTAASQFTLTPALPPSFEEDPVLEEEIEAYYDQRLGINHDNLYLLPQTNLLKSLHTIVRNKDISRADFRFNADRIIKMLLNKGLDLLEYDAADAPTPVGEFYHGVKLKGKVCGVSVVRAGESMEQVLLQVDDTIKIGKILIQRDTETKLPSLYYKKLPSDIAESKVLLLDPMLATGGTANMAIEVLLAQGVKEKNIIFISFLTVEQGVAAVHVKHPQVKIVTSAIDERLNENAYMIPGIGDFGDRYFGTDK